MPDLITDLAHFGGELIAPIGTVVDRIFGDENREADRELQRDFARHGLRWRVEDAKEAGVHPLAALGLPLHGGQPVSVGDQDTFSKMGQDISRAVDAGSTSVEREQLRLLRLQGDHQDLVNKDLALSLNARLQADQVGPSKPSIIPQPLKPTMVGPNPGITVGEIPETTWARTAGGGRVPVPSRDVKESIEDQIIQEIGWAIRNNILPPGGIRESRGETWLPGIGWVPDATLKKWSTLGGFFQR